MPTKPTESQSALVAALRTSDGAAIARQAGVPLATLCRLVKRPYLIHDLPFGVVSRLALTVGYRVTVSKPRAASPPGARKAKKT